MEKTWGRKDGFANIFFYKGTATVKKWGDF